MSDWKTLLSEAVAATSCATVAREIGMSRTAVSLALRGKYPGGTERMARRVVDRYDGVCCPLGEHPITRTACAVRQTEPMPTSCPAALEQWITCKRCEHRQHQ